jgi:lysophospholipase L1-like esterase
LRQVFRVSMGGSRLRVRLSNEYGDGPVTLNAVRCARATELGAIDTATDTPLSFAGSASVTIQHGQIAWSDPFDFALTPLGNVSVSIHFGAVPSGVTGHPGSRTTSYLAVGDNVSAANLSTAVRTDHWYFVTGIDVAADADAAAVVVLGDSLTDGRGSTTNGNDRWPDVLASRLQANPATSKVGVLNLGIGGNAVLSGGLGPTARARFDSQVLDQSGVRFLIVLEGVNDIGASSSTTVAQGLISAYQEFITKAHGAGVLAYGVPILPFGGSSYTSTTREAARALVNDWIRTSGAWDAVIDLDAAVRDSNDPTRLRAEYDSGDRLHLSPAGYRSMGEAVDLALLEP